MNGKGKWFAASPSIFVAAAFLLSVPAVTQAATFTVNSTADTVDVQPGDGVCADSTGACTLRAAVMEANALAGADTIDLSQINDPNNPIILTIKGADETYIANPSGPGYVAQATHDASIGDLNIVDDTTITGAGSGQTIIEWSTADQADASGDRIFHIEAVSANISVTMSGLTVRNGVTPAVVDIDPDVNNPNASYYQFKRHGGGIAIGVAAAVNLFDPTVTHGGGGGGGGGGGHGGEEGETGFAVDSVTLTDVNVLNCISGADGGGVYNTAPLSISNSVLSGNTATANGGALYASATTNINNTTIGTMASNAAFSNPNHAENGGGIFDTGLHTTTITNSSLVGNTATGGGAIAGRSTTIDDIENSTISGNVAQDVAGGIATNGRVNLKNVTVSGNSVVPTSTTESGAGVGLYSFGSGSYTLVNSIVSNNTIAGATVPLSNCGRAGGESTSTGSFFTSSGHNLEDGDTCNLNATGDLKSTDPALEALANNGGLTETMALPQTSPAIDAGDNSVCPNNDQRGEIRPADGNLDGNFVCDIGAFELFVHTADLHIQNMTAPDQTYTGDAFHVTIEVHNDPTATTDATGVVITTDPLPTDFSVSSANVTTPGGTSACTIASNVVTCDVGTLAVDTFATADIEGATTAPGSLSITGNVSATAPIDPLPGNNSAQVNIQVTGNSDMGITASGDTNPVNAGTDTTLDFTVTNNGPDPGNGVRMAAFLPDGLVYKSVTIDTGTCSYSSDDASVTCLIGAMAASASVTGTLTATANADGPANVLFGTDVEERDSNPDNDTATVALSLAGVSDLSVAGTLSQTNIKASSLAIPWTLKITNLGPIAATNVKLVATAPNGLMVSASGTGATCNISAGTATCTLPTLAANASTNISLSLDGNTKGTYTLSATVSSDYTDPVSSNNKTSATLNISDSSSGGVFGGCTYWPNSPFDPTLPTLLGIALLGLLVRNRARGQTRDY